MQKKLGRNTVVLLGVGHTNAHVLRMWKMNPISNAQLVCISDFPVATYSGMLPGVLSGQYKKPEMEIDLVRFANSAGARIIIGNVTGLDRQKKLIEFESRPPLSYDLLSIGVGSRPSMNGVKVVDDSPLVRVKPMQTFLGRLAERAKKVESGRRPEIVIVGGGIGSIEVAFCLAHRFKHDKSGDIFQSGVEQSQISIVTGGAKMGAGLLDSTVEKVRKQLNDRDIVYKENFRVQEIREKSVVSKDGTELPADIVIWATNAVAPELLSRLGLATDPKGFLFTKTTLQSIEDDNVFAVGDTGTIQGAKLPKAGVYAVRQAPFLWKNIQAVLNDKRPDPFIPQRDFLKLINTGDDKTIAEYKGRSFYGGWCWKLKDRIDKKFMKMYQDYSLMEMKPEVPDAEDAMRCLGCGGKIGSQVLSQILAELDVKPHASVKIGLDQPDDAAIVLTKNNEVSVTTDFFAAPLEDPYLAGRIATLNSASDCFVMGAKPTAALAIVQLPLGHPRAQRQYMRELMSGAVEELNRMGATIVGGHTIEGPRTLIGFTVLGDQVFEPKTKGQLAVGDHLVISKPIGTGVLLAGLMQSKLEGRAYPKLVETMVQSNEIALELIEKFSLAALTDVTGFGLAGHLAEMLVASSVSAEIEMLKVPVLDGCQSLIEQGIESTLAPDNRSVANKVELIGPDLNDKRIAPLFDPQTGGGLLFGVAENQLNSVLDFLADNGFVHAASIGRVTSKVPISLTVN